MSLRVIHWHLERCQPFNKETSHASGDNNSTCLDLTSNCFCCKPKNTSISALIPFKFLQKPKLILNNLSVNGEAKNVEVTNLHTISARNYSFEYKYCTELVLKNKTHYDNIHLRINNDATHEVIKLQITCLCQEVKMYYRHTICIVKASLRVKLCLRRLYWLWDHISY